MDDQDININVRVECGMTDMVITRIIIIGRKHVSTDRTAQ